MSKVNSNSNSNNGNGGILGFLADCSIWGAVNAVLTGIVTVVGEILSGGNNR